MKIFITGGAGFIGSHVVKQSLAAGHAVAALRLQGEQAKIPLPSEPEWVVGSLASDWRKHFVGCDAVIHLAASGVNIQNLDWKQLFAINVEQSLNLWLGAVEAGVKRLVICGSCFEYGRAAERYKYIPSDASLEPTGPYHASKAAATMAALALAVEKNLELALLRPFHVFGEGEAPARFWPSLRKSALCGEDFPMTTGEQVRDFVPVETVAAAFVSALTRTDLQPGNPRIENIGTGRPQTLRAFAEHWWQIWGATGKLLPGALPYRSNEVMRYVPQVSVTH